jgi:hypothetical protein
VFRDRTFAASVGTLFVAGRMLFGSGPLLRLYYRQV